MCIPGSILMLLVMCNYACLELDQVIKTVSLNNSSNLQKLKCFRDQEGEKMVSFEDR